MKVLVLGSNGMLGHVVALYFKKKGHIVDGIARNNNPFINTFVFDLRDTDQLSGIIKEEKYDFIINCAALLVGESEKSNTDSIFINSYLPHFVADLISRMDTKLIQISTESVFSGETKIYYSDKDRKDCTRFYDFTKAIGEIDDCKNITIRTSVIGFESKNTQKSLLNWFLHQKNEVEGYDDVIWSGVTNIQYARILEQLIPTDKHGIFHLSNNLGISKGDLLRLFNNYLHKNKIEVKSNKNVSMSRILICSEELKDYEVPSYEIMVLDLKNWVKDNHDYYKHFYRESLDEIINLEE